MKRRKRLYFRSINPKERLERRRRRECREKQIADAEFRWRYHLLRTGIGQAFL